MPNRSARAVFHQLLTDIDAALAGGLPLVMPGQDGPVQLDFRWAEQDVSLVFNPHAAPPCLSVACPLGPVPVLQTEAVLRQLLRIGHLAATSGSAVGYAPDVQHLYLVNSLPLHRADARLVLDTMAGLAELAARWQHGHFLDTDPPADAVAAVRRA